MEQSIQSLVWITFPIYFVGLWMFVSFLISRMGWHGFASKYAISKRPEGRSFNCRSAWFGNFFATYGNVVRVVFTTDGIYVYPMFLFRAFHQPFLVPWDKVVGVAVKRGWLLWTRHELEMRDESNELHAILSDAALAEFEKFRNA